MKIEDYIDEFIISVQEFYPELKFKYRYIDISDEYEVVYNTSDFDYEIVNFQTVINDKANQIFTENDIYNVYLTDEYYPYKKISFMTRLFKIGGRYGK